MKTSETVVRIMGAAMDRRSGGVAAWVFGVCCAAAGAALAVAAMLWVTA